MEIERKFLINKIPFNINDYEFHLIEQAYLCTEPVIRIRRQDNSYYMTYKSKGFLSREEYNLPLTEESYNHLLKKADGNIITKERYIIPFGKYTIELDVFKESFNGLVLAEVEFDTEDEADSFVPPEWFGEDVTYSPEYYNSTLSQKWRKL